MWRRGELRNGDVAVSDGELQINGLFYVIILCFSTPLPRGGMVADGCNGGMEADEVPR